MCLLISDVKMAGNARFYFYRILNSKTQLIVCR